MDLVQTVALSAGLAWASGLRLYLVIFLAGMLARFGYLHLPETLLVLQHPAVIAAAGLMALAEAVAEVWTSLDTPTAAAYRERLGIGGEPAMAVLVGGRGRSGRHEKVARRSRMTCCQTGQGSGAFSALASWR